MTDNGKYFYGGILEGHYGNFHIIDLVDLSVQSHLIVVDEIEYDFIRNRLIYEKNGTLYSLDLLTFKSDTIKKIENGNSSIYGQKRTFVPHLYEYFYVDYKNGTSGDPYFLSINADFGEISCSPRVEESNGVFYVPGGLVTNYFSGDILGHRNGVFGILDKCSGTMSKLSRIMDYDSHLNKQMTVYNHADSTYIIPYLSNDTINPYKIAVVDVYENKILKTVIQPFNGRMELHQIYDKPEAPLIYLNDTLFVPFGDDYRWYLDGEFIGKTYVNYLIPEVSGKYKAEVDFREYSTFSTEVDVVLTSITGINNLENINIYPNPADNFIKLDLGDHNNVTIKILDLGGKEVRMLKVKDSSELTIELNGLSNGAYLVSVQTEQRVFNQLIIKQ